MGALDARPRCHRRDQPVFISMERPVTSQHFSQAHHKGLGVVGQRSGSRGRDRGTEASASLHLDSCKVQVKPGLAQQGQGSASWEQCASLWPVDPSWGVGPEAGNRRLERWAESPQSASHPRGGRQGTSPQGHRSCSPSPQLPPLPPQHPLHPQRLCRDPPLSASLSCERPGAAANYYKPGDLE